MTRRLMKSCSGVAVLALLVTVPAQAEIASEAGNGFSVTHEVTVSADPEATYAMVRSPSKWWSGEHTFTLNAENLYMDAQAGGCFCELIPAEGDAIDRSLRGSVQHMRILYAEPGKLLRLTGALGPLQSEAVNGTLSIKLEPIKGGTLITFDYVVGGYMRFPVAAIAPAVDKVMGEQASRLAMAIGPLVGGKRLPSQPLDKVDEKAPVKKPDATDTASPDKEAVVEGEQDDVPDDENLPEPEIRPGDDLLNVMAGLGADDTVTAPPE